MKNSTSEVQFVSGLKDNCS